MKQIVAIFHEGCPTSSLSVDPPNPKRTCATCQEKIDMNNPKWTIRLLPSPLVATQEETAGCIVIKLSDGHFSGYTVGKDLHIGISNSKGHVYSFWTKGVQIEKFTWQSSVPLLDLRQFYFGNREMLDNCIEFFVDTTKITQRFHKSKYRSEEWNCFNFILEFLRFINFRTYSKVDFAAEFTTKKVQGVVKYMTLYNKLLKEN